MSIKLLIRVGSVAALVLLVIVALGPAKWVPRSGLGWQIDHLVGYFAFTLTVCLAWPRPVVLGGAVMVLAVLLEALQAFTADRHPDLQAALISAGGALAAVLPADLFIRAPRWLNPRTLMMLQSFVPRWPFPNNARTGLLTASRRSLVPGGVPRTVAPPSSTLAGPAFAVRVRAGSSLNRWRQQKV